jgi:hypothetical protein
VSGFSLDRDDGAEVEVEISSEGWVEVWVNGSFTTEFDYLGDLQDHLSIEGRVNEVLNRQRL